MEKANPFFEKLNFLIGAKISPFSKLSGRRPPLLLQNAKGANKLAIIERINANLTERYRQIEKEWRTYTNVDRYIGLYGLREEGKEKRLKEKKKLGARKSLLIPIKSTCRKSVFTLSHFRNTFEPLSLSTCVCGVGLKRERDLYVYIYIGYIYMCVNVRVDSVG